MNIINLYLKELTGFELKYNNEGKIIPYLNISCIIIWETPR